MRSCLSSLTIFWKEITTAIDCQNNFQMPLEICQQRQGLKGYIPTNFRSKYLFLFIFIFYFSTHDWSNNHLKHLGSNRLGVLIRPVWL